MSQLEHQLQHLEAIIQSLNNNKLPLDELLSLYEEGMELANQCRSNLAKAEQKITMIQQRLSPQAEDD
ncbi:MAG: exodeoxyribonuclease VII small subunit [Pseudanabaena sp. ELA607]|jgi:exodeoxyribonuclease VII small subunit